MKRGRPTTGDLMVLVHGGRRMPPPPPAELTPEQSKIWADALGGLPGDWLTPAAYPIMKDYCRHVCRAKFLESEIAAFQCEWLRAEGGVERLDKLLQMAERETRASVACARALRLTPASVVRAETAGRKVRNFHPGPVPWDDNEG
jgi:hypothetical protein